MRAIHCAAVVLFSTASLVVTGCKSECCDHTHQEPAAAASASASASPVATAPATETPAAVLATPSLGPNEPVDARFSGCAMSCGAGPKVDRNAAHIQPGAEVGDLAFCVVSGAVFNVTGASPRRVVGGKTIYFCCEACARYFSEHSEEILQRRGIAQT